MGGRLAASSKTSLLPLTLSRCTLRRMASSSAPDSLAGSHRSGPSAETRSSPVALSGIHPARIVPALTGVHRGTNPGSFRPWPGMLWALGRDRRRDAGRDRGWSATHALEAGPGAPAGHELEQPAVLEVAARSTPIASLALAAMTCAHHGSVCRMTDRSRSAEALTAAVATPCIRPSGGNPQRQRRGASDYPSGPGRPPVGGRTPASPRVATPVPRISASVASRRRSLAARPAARVADA